MCLYILRTINKYILQITWVVRYVQTYEKYDWDSK